MSHQARSYSFALVSFFLLPGIYSSWAQTSLSGISIYSSQSKQEVVISSIAEWEKERWKIQQGMQAAMGALPYVSGSPAPDIIFQDTLMSASYLRINLLFLAAENEWVPAFLYLPKRTALNGRSPAMVALHPTGMLGKKIVDGQGNANRGYARELAERGYVVIAPDYPSFGDLEHYDFDSDRYESATMAAIFYHMRCVDLLSSRQDVDPSRIGVIGHSLGGHNAMFLGAFDHRVKVIVASCGWTQFEFYDVGPKAIERFGGRLGPWAQQRYMPLLRDKFQLDDAKFPFNFHEIIALLAPRYFFSNSPANDGNFAVAGVREGIQKAKVVYDFLDVSDHVQVRYPAAEHDFPTAVRTEAYEFTDRVLGHHPSSHLIE
ncbi:MAG: alpha/beta fold hydrolase [Saprospiraceae bacterium]|nr:alpha/beta fold hydrolase [Saprospiraceae bacterium]